MAEPSPDAVTEGQEPEADEGQVPAGDAPVEDSPEESKTRTYSEAYVKQLRREAAGNRTRMSELEARLEEIEGRDKSEQEKLAERVTTAETRATEAEVRLMRYEVAAEAGLDMQAAAFLTGTTREEIELRAEELVKLLADKAKPAAGFDGGARQPAQEKKPPEQEHNDFLLEAMRRSRGS